MVQMRHLRRSQPAASAAAPIPAAVQAPAPARVPSEPTILAPLQSTNRSRVSGQLPGLASALAGGHSVSGVKRAAPGTLDVEDIEVIDLTGD